MSEVASRELRNHTADLLRRVADGEVLDITVNGRPVARLGPIPAQSSRAWTRDELFDFLRGDDRADPGLYDELRILAGETTDDLGPIR
jgi:prevent-host-death family protein